MEKGFVLLESMAIVLAINVVAFIFFPGFYIECFGGTP